MFCPKCRFEYKPEVTKCPDCEVWLVSTLPEEQPNPNDIPNESDEIYLTSIYVENDFSKIQLIKAVLEDALIPHYVKNKNLKNDPLPHGAMTLPYEILVHPEDVDEAVELITALEEEENQVQITDKPDDPPPKVW
jgi:hypothetical protein